jgi:methylglyoxal synthase
MQSREGVMTAKTFALISHDHKKVDLLAWANYNRSTLQRFRVVATATTGRLLREKVGIVVETALSGPQGGDVQIAARVASGQIHAVFFFLDPLTAQPHDPDIQALMRVCNVHNVPLATNLATADLIITGLGDEERMAAFQEAERVG